MKSDDSLFTPGKKIWSLDNINSLDEFFVQNPIETSKIKFYDKFKTQLSSAPDETIQLAAEMLYTYFLIVMSVKPETKRDAINLVLSWMNKPPNSLPDEIDDDEYDADYYINHQVVPAVERIFDVFGYKKEELLETKDQTKLEGFF